MSTPDPRQARLRALVAAVGGFYVRDRAVRRAQAEMEKVLAREGVPPPRQVAQYLAVVGRYFDGFARDAHKHLADVDRRLERLYQLQYNLTAERGVAARRVDRTQGVLAAIAELSAE